MNDQNTQGPGDLDFMQKQKIRDKEDATHAAEGLKEGIVTQAASESYDLQVDAQGSDRFQKLFGGKK